MQPMPNRPSQFLSLQSQPWWRSCVVRSKPPCSWKTQLSRRRPTHMRPSLCAPTRACIQACASALECKGIPLRLHFPHPRSVQDRVCTLPSHTSLHLLHTRNSTRSLQDVLCDDGGASSSWAYCELGSDCADCGVRYLQPPAAPPPPPVAPPSPPLSPPPQPRVSCVDGDTNCVHNVCVDACYMYWGGGLGSTDATSVRTTRMPA